MLRKNLSMQITSLCIFVSQNFMIITDAVAMMTIIADTGETIAMGAVAVVVKYVAQDSTNKAIVEEYRGNETLSIFATEIANISSLLGRFCFQK